MPEGKYPKNLVLLSMHLESSVPSPPPHKPLKMQLLHSGSSYELLWPVGWGLEVAPPVLLLARSMSERYRYEAVRSQVWKRA